MNLLALVRKIRSLSEEWRGVLSSYRGDTHAAASLQRISDGLSQSADELQKLWSWGLTSEDAAGVFGSQAGRTAAALQQTALSDDGLLGSVATAALENEAAHVSLKTRALELCRLTLSSGCDSAVFRDPQAFEELFETCMGIFAVDSSLKVKRAALRLIRVALVPESGTADLRLKQRRFVSEKPVLGVSVLEKILLRLSGELSHRGKKLGTTVRSELYVVIAALLKSFRSYPLLTRQWQPPLLQQIILHLQAVKHLPKTGQVETLGALEALREVLVGDKTAGKLLPADAWRGVYAYVVTVGTQSGSHLLLPQEAAGKMSVPSVGEAAGRGLQQAALAVLQEGAESFVFFLDRDIAADFAGGSPSSKLPVADAIKEARSSQTLLDRLLSLTASSNAGIAYTASRALSRIVGALCAARLHAFGEDAGSPCLPESKKQAEAAQASASSASAARDAREAHRGGTLPDGGRLECDAALQSFSMGVVADLQRDSLMPQPLQVQQPEGWWQQCGCRGFVAYRSLSLLSGVKFRVHGSRAAAACLRLAAAGCGSAWQRQHGPSCNKQALHLLGAAGAIVYSLLQGVRLQGPALGSSQELPLLPRHVKRRRVSALKHQRPGADELSESEPQASSLLLGEFRQLGGCLEGGMLNDAETLPRSLFTQLRQVSVALFELHAKAGAFPMSLAPKAAAAVGRAVRALISGAAAEGLAVVVADDEASGGAGEARPSKVKLGHVRELDDAEASGGIEASEDAFDTEGAQAEDEEGLYAGQGAALALRGLIRESLSLALADHTLQPPTFVSVAFLWKSILGGGGQGDSLKMDLGDDAYRSPFRPARLDSSKGSTKDKRERVQRALQRGAWSGIGAFSQALFGSAEDEEEVEATETVLLQGRPTLAASCSVTAALKGCQMHSWSMAGAAAEQSSVEVNERAATAEGLVAFSVGLVSARSEAQLLQRISGCFCHLFSDAAARSLFFSASWIADFAALLQEAITTLSPGPGTLAMLQAARPLIDEWRSRVNDCATSNHSYGVILNASVSAFRQQAVEPVEESKSINACCCVHCKSGEGRNSFAVAEEAVSRLLVAVASATLSLPAEEAAAAVALLLAAPDSFLFVHPHLFMETIQRSFRLGRSHLPLACAAVSALRRWLRHQQQTNQEEDLLLRIVLPSMRPFIVASAERKGHSETVAHTALLHEAAQADFTESELRLVVSRLQASGLQEVLDEPLSSLNAWSPHVVSIRRLCLGLLGDLGPRRALWMLGGSRDLSLSGMLALQSCEDRCHTRSGVVFSEMFIRTSLRLGSAPGSALMCFPVKRFIVNVANAAVDALSRQARATFCELLAALVCAVSQEAESCIRTQSEGVFTAVAVPDARVSEREGVTAAAAMAALYKAILPFFLEVLASSDPVPSQLLSPVMLRCLWTSVDAALLPTLRPDPRLAAVLEVLIDGLGEDCASRRSAAASGFVALISRVLRRLNRRERSASLAGAAAAPEVSASLHDAMGASEAQREVLLLKRILRQGVLLPLSYGGPARHLGGLAVLSSVLPLGGPACRCTAARDAFSDFAFKCLVGLLSGLRECREAKEEDAHASSTYSCGWCPPSSSAQGTQPNEVVGLQCLQAIAATGQFLIRRYRAECLETARASTELTTVTESDFGGQQASPEERRTHRLLLQGQSLFKQLRHFALYSKDGGMRDVCRSLLSQLASTGLAVEEAVVTTTEAGGARTRKDWTAAGIADLQSTLEDLLAGKRRACSRARLSEPFAQKLRIVLDSLCWLAQHSAKAYESVAEDLRMLNYIRRGLEVVWLEERTLSNDVSSETQALLAEASLRLCLLVSPPGHAEMSEATGASAATAGRLLLHCIIERSAGVKGTSLVPSPSDLSPGVIGAKLHEGEAEGIAQGEAKSAPLCRESLMSSLVRFLLNPSAFGFALTSYSSLDELRRLAVSILQAFALEDLTCVPPSAGGGCAKGVDVHRVSAFLKKCIGARQQESQPMKNEDLGDVEMTLATSICRVRGPVVRGVECNFVAALLAPFVELQPQDCEQQPIPWIPVLALQAYVEALEALEKIYGRQCLFEDAEKKRLLLTGTSPAKAASTAVDTAANVLKRVRPHSLLGQSDGRIRHGDCTEGHKAWQQIVVLLLRLGLLYTRCAATGDGVEDSIASNLAQDSASGTQRASLRLQEEAQAFLSVASFPVALLVPPVCEVESGADQGIILPFLSTLEMLRRQILTLELTRCPAHYVHLLHLLAALIRRQAKAGSDARASPRTMSATVLASAGGVLPDEDSKAREEHLLLHVVLDAFELWQSSGVCGANPQQHPPEGAAAVMALSLPRQKAALADLLVAASSWRMLLEALPHRDGALRFIADVASSFLSGTTGSSTQVQAAALRGAFLVVILADLLHEASAEKHGCLTIAGNRGQNASSSRLSLQQRQSEADEDRALAARRASLTAALRACSEGLSAMVAGVFPLVSTDLRLKRRAREVLAAEKCASSRRDASSAQASADARKYAVLLRSLQDLTLLAFSAAAEWEAESIDVAGTGPFSKGVRTVPTVAEQGTAETSRSGGDAVTGSRAGDEQGTALPDYSRRFSSLKLCLTHLHDTLREEQHCFHQRIRRFLSSLVSICSQPKCHRLRFFVISHCFGLLLADVPRQRLPVSTQQGVDAPFSGSSLAASLKRPLLGTRVVEVLALPLLFKAGRAQAVDSGKAFYCQVWRLLWERASELLSPQWANVVLVFQRLRSPATEEQVALITAVRQLQVFASVCGAFEVLFCVTPLNIFRSAVAPLLLAAEGSSAVSGAAAAPTASSRTAAPSAGAVVTRKVIAAVSSAMRAFEEASVSLSHHHRIHRQEAKHAHTDGGRGANASLLDLLRACLWKGRVRSYGCLSAAVCSTQSNASLYDSLLTSDAAGLLLLVDDELLSFSQRMRLHKESALPLWAPVVHQPRQEKRASLEAYSFAFFSFGHEKQDDHRKWAGSLRSLRATTANATLSALEPTTWTVPPAHPFVGLEGQRRLLWELSQSVAQGPGEEQLLSKFVWDRTLQHVHTPSQHFQPDSILGKRWLQCISSASPISSAFAAKWSRLMAAATATPRSNGEAAATAQERVEATLCGRVDETDVLLFDASQYSDPVGRSAVSQLLHRVLDCASIRFGPEWGLAATTAAAKQNLEETGRRASSSSNLPAVLQALLNHCNSRVSTPTGFRAEEAPGDAEGDRAWAFRLVLLRLFAQRANLLFPLADKGLLDFVAESVADHRLLSAKRLHYWLRDLALLIVRWIQTPRPNEEQPVGNLGLNADRTLPPPLRPLTAARLAAFAESLIRLCTCRDARIHKLNIELVGTLLERLHSRLSGIERGRELPRLPAASQGIPFLQLSLPSFFIYESLRSVEETARFRLSGVAVVRFLCELERRQRSSLHVDGGPYSKTLCNRNLFLAASRALLFPWASVAIEAAALCGLLLSVLPTEPLMLAAGESRRPLPKSGRDATDMMFLGHTFLGACHRRLQHLSAAEVAATNGNPPTLCGSIALGARSSDREGGSLGAQEQQHSEGHTPVSGEVAKEREEELKVKSMLYSFNYDGRFAEVAAALAREQPLLFLGEPGSVPWETFQALVSHLPMLYFHQSTRAASQQSKRDRKCAALFEAVRSVCCCNVAEEAAGAPGCAALCFTLGVAAAATGGQRREHELTIAQEQLSEWQRQSTDSALEALEAVWASLLTHQRAPSVLLSALSLLKSLLERWGNIGSLLGAIQAMVALLEKPPSDGAVRGALFEVCAWLRGHSQEYADSPSLLAFMLGPLPDHLKELKQRQLDYWFGDDAALPKDPPERIRFLLSAGLSEASAPHMLHLLTAAVCYQQRRQEERGQLKESETSRNAQGTQAGSPRPLAALASLVLRGAGLSGRPAFSRQKSYKKQHTAGDSVSIASKRGEIWGGASQLRGLTGSRRLSLRGANTLVLPSGREASVNSDYLWRRPAAQRQPARTSPVASESSSTDELDVQGEGFADESISLFRGGAERSLSRATGVAIHERRRRRMLALLRRHQNALAGKEETVELVRDCYSPGDPSQFVISPLEMLQLVGEASKLNASLAAEFLLFTIAAHSVLPSNRRTPQDILRGTHNSGFDMLGLVSAGRQVLESCCTDLGESSSFRCDRPLLTFLQRLVLQAFFHKDRRLTEVLSCSPMHLYELARSTGTLEVALLLLEEMTCKQQEHSLSAVSRQQSLAQRQQAKQEATCSLRLCLSSLYLGYGDLGQPEWQRSALQLLALHGCFKRETTDGLLGFLWGTDCAGTRVKPAEAAGQDPAQVYDINQQHEESDEGAWLAGRLLRDAQLQSLQRMMQWKPLVNSYAPRLPDTSRGAHDMGAAATSLVQRARGTADLKQRVELGGGCLVRAAVALSLSGESDALSEDLLKRLMRLLSPAYFLRAHEGDEKAKEGFGSAIPAPLKISLCQLLALHAVSKDLLLDASLLGAEAVSELQDLVSGIAVVPSSLFLSTMTRVSLSLLIDQGLAAMQYSRGNKRRVDFTECSGAALQSFLIEEIGGGVRPPLRKGQHRADAGKPLFRCHIEAAPFPGCLDALFGALTFIEVMGQQQQETETIEGSDEGHTTEVAGSQGMLLPLHLRCAAVSHASRQLINERGGVRAATVLLQDMLQRQQQQQQLDAKLFGTVIRLRLRELRGQFTTSSSAVAKAQQLLRTVQREASRLVTAGDGNQWVPEEDGMEDRSLLTALQLSCHCAVLQQLQRFTAAPGRRDLKELEAASSEALSFLFTITENLKNTCKPPLEQPNTTVSPHSLRAREKCLWKCAALAKETLSSLQEARDASAQGNFEAASSATIDGGVRDTRSSVGRLFCEIVVDLVASGGSTNKYGKRGAALIPSVLLLCAEASRPLSLQGKPRVRGEDAKKKMEAEDPKSAEDLANKRRGLSGAHGAAESVEELEARLTRLLAKIPVESLGTYFPQLLSFISADESGYLTSALLSRLHEVIAADPHRAFHCIQTATSAAFRAEASYPQGSQGQAEERVAGEALLAPVSLLDVLRMEALRRAPIASPFAAACDLLQPPERRLRQQLLEPLLEVLWTAAPKGNSDSHMRSEQRLPPPAAAKWRSVWTSACNSAVIGESHAVLGEAVDLRTKKFAANIKEVVCSFLEANTKERRWNSFAAPLSQPFAECTVEAMLELPVNKLMDLLRILSREASRVAAVVGLEQRLELPLSQASPWLSRFSSEELPGHAGTDGFFVTQARHRLPVPFSTASTSAKTPEIISFCERVVALPSKQMPMRLSFFTSDGYCYSVLVKGGEDLRLDQRIQTLMQILTQLDPPRILAGDSTLRLRPYGVLPMSETHGLVEWIACTSPLMAVCETYSRSPLASSPACMRYARFLSEMIAAVGAEGAREGTKSVTIAEVWSKIFELPPEPVERVFQECVELATTRVTPPSLRTTSEGGSRGECSNCNRLSVPPVPPAKAVLECLMAIVDTFEELTEAKKRFSASLAASGAVCYCLGIGDRHLGNCLLDLKTGECINIDFGYAFDVAVHDLPVPELAPLRLSPCLLRVVGPPGARNAALLHSPFFDHLNTENMEPPRGIVLGPGRFSAVPSHAWVAGSLGLFETCFADVLDFIRNQRLVVEAVVEMFASRQKAALWKLEEASEATGPSVRASSSDEEALNQNLHSAVPRGLTSQPQATAVAVRLETGFTSSSLLAQTNRQRAEESKEDEEAARRTLAFVKRKLRGEHPSLILLDLLQCHCEVNYLTEQLLSPFNLCCQSEAESLCFCGLLSNARILL
ncbi:hypothetical protein Esti_000035 [Eimeria stiedai]